MKMKEKKKKYVGKHLAKSSGRKKAVVFGAVGCLALLAVCTVSFAVITAKAHGKEKEKVMTDAVATPDSVEIKTEQVQYFIDENQYKIDLDDLQKDIEQIIEQTKNSVGSHRQ